MRYKHATIMSSNPPGQNFLFVNDKSLQDFSCNKFKTTTNGFNEDFFAKIW